MLRISELESAKVPEGVHSSIPSSPTFTAPIHEGPPTPAAHFPLALGPAVAGPLVHGTTCITLQLRCATAANTSTGANLTTACFLEGGGVTMLPWDNWQAEAFKDEE